MGHDPLLDAVVSNVHPGVDHPGVYRYCLVINTLGLDYGSKVDFRSRLSF